MWQTTTGKYPQLRLFAANLSKKATSDNIVNRAEALLFKEFYEIRNGVVDSVGHNDQSSVQDKIGRSNYYGKIFLDFPVSGDNFSYINYRSLDSLLAIYSNAGK